MTTSKQPASKEKCECACATRLHVAVPKGNDEAVSLGLGNPKASRGIECGGLKPPASIL